MSVMDLQILSDLKELYPNGAEFRQFQIYSPDKWKSYTSNGQIRGLIKYFPQWAKTEFILIGGTDFGDPIVVTDTDPVHEAGAIYMIGEGFGMLESDEWPEGVLCLGTTVSIWQERIQEYADEPAISPGSMDEDLGNRAERYRKQLIKLNPLLDW